ncbi:MAG: T9SS type A sorting domain-containing protein, partial [Bacteroidetes bacterium]|nr:T9SS type A sorting domain-containing protein [Bacteroidota bacterium]
SGTGTFSNDTIPNPLYYASPDDITNGNVRLTLHAYGMFASDSTDTMILYFVSPPEASAGIDGSVCANETFTVTTASASGYQSLLWSSSGDGTFSDPAIIHPGYTPGQQDVANGSATLFLTCYAQPPCQMTTDSLDLTILESPVFWLGNDTTVCTGQFLVLDATTTGVSQYMWYPGLQTTSSITIDSTGIGVGTQEFIAVLTNTLGCTGRDTIRITFINCPGIEEAGITGLDIRPNPNNGNFTISFTTTKEKTIGIQVIDLTGSTVFKLPPQQVMGPYRKDLNLEGLRQGTYFLELTDEHGKITRKLIIQK